MFYFAWIDDGTIEFSEEHHRCDEHVFSAIVEQAEGEFATLTVEIRNPKIGILNSSRKQWIWFSEEKDGSVYPLFKGKVSSVPADMDREVITLEFTAKPSDYTTRKKNLATSLKVAPYYDPVWIPVADQSDPDTALEGRSSLWHIDRKSHEVTISDYNRGEDGVIELDRSQVFNDSISVSFGSVPTDTISLTAKVSWDQTCTRTIDISSKVANGFDGQGSQGGNPSTYTGNGLQSVWPLEGDDIGGDWTFGPCVLSLRNNSGGGFIDSCIQADGDTLTNPVTARFYLWVFKQSTKVKADSSRARTETLTITANSSVQTFSTTDESDVLELSYDSELITQDVDGTGVVPIVNPSRRTYFGTDRGKRSIDYLMCVIRANFMKSARCVEIEFDSNYDLLRDITLRKDVTLSHPNLPGGSVRGKVISYKLSIDGDSGSCIATIRIGCTIGTGTNLTGADEGEATYTEGDYADGYEATEGATEAPVEGEIKYTPPVITFGDGGTVTDDGLDLETMGANEIVTEFAVRNGEYVQAAVLQAGSDTLDNLISALKAVYTYCELTLVPLNTGPFDNTFPVSTEMFYIPKTIDLGA